MDEQDVIVSRYLKPEGSLTGSMECIFCPKTFKSTENGAKNPILAHLLAEHKFVIAEVQHITNFPCYIHYWKKRFLEVSIVDICAVIKTNSRKDDTGDPEDYYLLTNFLPEDRILRERLKEDKISNMLEEQRSERDDSSFSRQCLFCKQYFKRERKLLFEHMIKDHGFNIGNPDNIIHVNELLDNLAEKLKRLRCIYCSKEFKDFAMLKDHMRKKNHKRIDPKDKSYDKYYMINYLEPGRCWEELQAEPEEETEKADEDWSGWNEQIDNIFYCLFCQISYHNMENIQLHMMEEHDFDLKDIKQTNKFDFYQQIKAINYIRKQIEELKCPYCKLQASNRDDLNTHMDREKHCSLPEDKSFWDQPEYFFPTLENDSLLCFQLDDEDQGADHDDEILSSENVVPEDFPEVSR